MMTRVAGMLSASSINVALLALLSLILAKVLSVESFGITRTAIAYLGIVVIFAHATLPSAISAFVAGAPKDEDKINYVVTGAILVLGLSVVVTGIAEVVFLYSGFWDGKLRWILAAFMLVLPITCLLAFYSELLQAIGNYRQFSAYLVLMGLLQLIIVALMATLYDVEGWVLGRYLSGFALLALGGYFIRSYFRWQMPNKEAARELISFSKILFFSGIMSNVMVWADIIVLERISGDLRQVAIYGVAALFSKFMMFVPMAIGRIYFKRIAESAQNPFEQWELEKSFLYLVGGVCTGVALLLFFFAPLGIAYLYGDAYAESTPILRVLCLAVVANGFWTGLAVINNATKRPKHAVAISAIGVVIALSALFAWVPSYGAIGAAWAIVAANTGGVLMGFGLLWNANRHV